MAAKPTAKPVIWIASTKRDLKSLPDEIEDRVGYALWIAQSGKTHPHAKPLKGFACAKQKRFTKPYDRRRRAMAKKKIEFEIGSGNVFKDLGLKNPEERLAKVKLAAQIMFILEERKLTQTAAAKLLGIAQPKVSNVYRGNLNEFSIERLMRLLNRLHRDVRIVVETKERRQRGRMIVEAA